MDLIDFVEYELPIQSAMAFTKISSEGNKIDLCDTANYPQVQPIVSFVP